MHTMRIPSMLLVACGLLALLAGCGGGGSPASYGLVSGSVLTQAGEAMTRDSGAVIVGIEGTQLTAQPAADGSFVLTNVPPGVQTLYAETADGYLARSVVVMVESGRETQVGDLLLENAGWITGMVTSAVSGQPIAGARVTVTTALDENTAAVQACPIRVTYTENDGTYAVRGLPEGFYAVTIEKRGFFPVSLVLYVTAGHTTTGDATLTPIPPHNGSMSGTVYMVTDTGAPAPLPGALVCLVPRGYPVPGPLPNPTRPEDAASPARVYYTFSDRSGWYGLDGVPAGDYLAVAQRPGFDPDLHDVTIIANASIQQDFRLRPHPIAVGAITGTVTDRETGRPIAGAFVSAIIGPTLVPVEPTARSGSVVGPAGDVYRMCTITDENGHYELKVPVCVNAVLARKPGYVPQIRPVEVIPGETVIVDFRLVPMTNERFTLSGSVCIPESGGSVTPVADATVYVAPSSPGPIILDDGTMPAVIFSAQTDAEGRYTISLPAGVYQAFAVKDDLRSEMVKITLFADVTQNFLLQPAPVL